MADKSGLRALLVGVSLFLVAAVSVGNLHGG